MSAPTNILYGGINMSLDRLIRNITVVAAMAVPMYGCEGDTTEKNYYGEGGNGGSGSSCSTYCDRFLECDPDFFNGKNDDMNECTGECNAQSSSECGQLYGEVIDCFTSGNCSRWTENMDSDKRPESGNPCYFVVSEYRSCMGFD